MVAYKVFVLLYRGKLMQKCYVYSYALLAETDVMLKKKQLLLFPAKWLWVLSKVPSRKNCLTDSVRDWAHINFL